MSYHDDPDLESRLRRIAADEPVVPASLYRDLNDVAEGNAARSVNGVRLERVRQAGRGSFGMRRFGALTAVAAVLVVAVSAAGLLIAPHVPQSGATWTLRADAGQGEWTGLEWHDITSTAGGGFQGFGDVTKWRGGFAVVGLDVNLWTSHDGLTWQQAPDSPLASPGLAGSEVARVMTLGLATLDGDLLVIGRAADGSVSGIWRSADGVGWMRVAVPFAVTSLSTLTSGGPGVVAVNSVANATGLPGTADIYYSADAKSWTHVAPPDGMAQASGLVVAPYIGGFLADGLVSDPNGSMIFNAGTADELRYSERAWISRDGFTWTSYAPAIPSPETEGSLPWVGMGTGRLGAGDGRIYSTDGGSTWLADADNIPARLFNDQTVSDGQRIVMAADGGAQFYVSAGDGHWRLLQQGGDIGSFAAGGRAMLLPNGVLWSVGDRVYFGQALSGVEPRGSLGPITTPTPGITVPPMATSTPAVSIAPGPTMIATGFTTPGAATGWSGFTWSGIADSSPIRTPVTDFLRWSGGYVATATYDKSGGPTTGLWTSPDGLTWTPVTSIRAQAVFVAAAPAGLIAISVDPAGPYKPREVWASADGTTWKNLGWTDLPPQGALVSVAGTSAGIVATVAVGDSYSVLFSQDGVSWGPETGASGIQPAYGLLPQVQSVNGRFFLMGVDGPLAIDTRKPLFRLDSTTPHDVTLWSDDGRTWTPCGDYPGFAYRILAGRDGLLMEVNYEATPGGVGLVRSSDGGKTWTVDVDFGPLGVQSCNGECSIAPDGYIAANGTYFLAVQFDGQKAWLSYDGRTWTPIAWTGGDPASGGFVMLPRGVVAAQYGAAH